MTKTTLLDQSIAARVKAARLERKMTQPVVAAALSISYQSYQKLEGGKRAFRATTLLALAQLLGVTVEFLIHGTGKASALNNGEHIGHITAVVHRLSPDSATKVLNFAAELGRAA